MLYILTEASVFSQNVDLSVIGGPTPPPPLPGSCVDCSEHVSLIFSRQI